MRGGVGDSSQISCPDSFIFWVPCLVTRLVCKQKTTATRSKSWSMSEEEIPLVSALRPSLFSSPLWRSCQDSVAPRAFEEIRKPLDELDRTERTRVHGLICTGVDKQVDGKLMDLFPNLRVISNVGVGTNHLDVAAASDRGIAVGNTPHVLSDCTADMAFALMLASARNVVEGDHIAKCKETVKFDVNWYGVEVTGSTLGIVGLGSIGKAMAKRARGFDMRILYHNRNRILQTEENLLGAQYCSQLDDLLKQADFVMLAVPLTPQTENLISARELSLMKPTATLINISRGSVVNQDDLVEALRSGKIRGAGLDVTTPEPLPRDHPLLELPNVIITPHIGTATLATRKRMFRASFDNLVAGLKGEKLPYPLN